MKRNKIYFSAVYLFCLIALFTVKTTAQELPEEKQEIIKNFEAQLEEARMIEMAPEIKPILPVKKKYNYNVTILPLDISYPEPVIKPIAADADLPFENHTFFTRLGYGNVKNPSADLSFYKTDAYQFDRYINVSYKGFDNSTKVTNQKLNDVSTVAGIRYKIKENWQINAGVNGSYKQNPLYFIYADPLENTDRNIFRAGFKAEVLHETISEDDLDFALSTSYSVINVSNPDVNEGMFDLQTKVSKNRGNWKLTFPVQFTGVLQSNISDLYSIRFVPELKYSRTKWHLTAGAAIYYDADEKTVPWPQLTFDYALSGKNLHIFVGSKLRVEANHLHRITAENPWLNPNLPKLSNFLGKEIYGGVRGEGHILGYELAGGYVNGRNWDQFNNLTIQSNANAFFTALNAIFFRSSVDFAISNKVILSGSLIKNFFDKKGAPHLYGLHTFECKAQAQIKFWNGKVQLTPELFVTDRSWTQIEKDPGIVTDIRLNNRVELNTTLDIWFSNKLGLYVRAGNILNNRYEQWYGYPVLGIHGQGGILLKL